MDINGKVLVDLLKKEYSAKNNSQLAKKLGIHAMTIGNWERNSISPTLIKNFMNLIVKVERNKIRGEDFIAFAKRTYGKNTDSDISDMLGITQPAIVNWKKKGLTIRSVYDVLEKSKKAHTKTIVTPIIEFFPITQIESKQGKKYEILNQSIDPQKSLKSELNKFSGIYIFYDSRGNSVYAGKAKDQSLWKEMNLAFNRDRGYLQTMKRVSHLKINRFNPEKERKRQITSEKVFLHDIAIYFSAYKVDNIFIDNLEASIIRMFPNNLLNKKVEKYKHLK